MVVVADIVEDNQGIRIQRKKKKINKDKQKLYRGVNQDYQGDKCPLSKFYFGHFSGYFRAYLSRIEACPWFLRSDPGAFIAWVVWGEKTNTRSGV